MPPNAAKKQKLNTEDTSVTISASECVTFDTLIESEYPVDLIIENLLRMLNYDSLQGIGEIVSLAVRCSGCETHFELNSEYSTSDITDLVDQIESGCINSELGCPAAFPLQKKDLVKRVSQVLKTATSSLYDSANYDVLVYCSQLVAGLSAARLQSLRFVATTFAGVMASAYPSTSEETQQEDELAQSGRDTLIRALTVRCSDIAPTIRRQAVTDLGKDIPAEVARALNDVNKSVRLSALRTLGSLTLNNADSETSTLSADLEATNERIEQMACEDVDMSIRRSALRYLIAKNIMVETASMSGMLQDDDEVSRKLAAELIVVKHSSSTSSPQVLLVELADLVGTNHTAAMAVAHGLESVRGQFHAQWPVQMAITLTVDYEKESRRTKLAASKKQEYKLLASELNKDRTVLGLLGLVHAAISIPSIGSASLLEYISPLIHKMQHSEDLLAKTIAAFAQLQFEPLMARTESEKQSTYLFEMCRDIFMDRSDSRKVIEAVGLVFGAMPEAKRIHLLEDIHQDLRIKLARLLGPRGNYTKEKKTHIDLVVLQLIVIGRYVDISDLAKLPIWEGLANGDEQILQLVRAIGMKGDASLVKTTVQKLSERGSGPAVDDILRVLVAAKMRGIDVSTELPFDINEIGPKSETTWRAAVAAGVI